MRDDARFLTLLSLPFFARAPPPLPGNKVHQTLLLKWTNFLFKQIQV